VTAEPLQVRRLDPLVVGSVAALALLGWTLQLGIRAAAPEGSVENVTGFDQKQLQWYAVRVFASVLVLLVPYRVVLDRAYLVFAAAILLLLSVFAIGKSVKGAQRWIELGPASLQPSEFAKIALVVVLARYIRFREDQKTLRGLAIPFLLAAIPVALILRQPDLGTALLFIPVLAAVLYASGARPRHLGLVAVMGIASAPVIYFAALKPYQRERVKTFLALTGGSETDPDAERLRRQEGWQSDQARLAVASGGLFGLGHAQGPQNRAGAVPEHQTDFVFTVLAEEWGFLGTLAMVAIYGGLFTGLAGIARRTRDPAGKLLVTGVIALLGVQAFVNLAMTVGLGPVTGVPLPFLSYGGSTTLTSFVAVALALNVGARPGFDFGPSDFR